MFCKNKAIWNLAVFIAIFLSCNTVKQSRNLPGKMDQVTAEPASSGNKPPDLLESLLKSNPQFFGDILENRNALNVQIIYTQVNRGKNGVPNLAHHYFNVNDNNYFYPASTVKLPIVLLALQKLNALKTKGIDRNTTMVTESAYSGQTSVYNDPTTNDGKPNIAHYIKKILLVSDNDAYNRLYEFLGQDYIQTEMRKKGYADVQILHRLNIFLTEAENRRTNPVKFYNAANKLLYEQPAQTAVGAYTARKDSLGKGYFKAGKLINTPMDFSAKNRIGLESLHKILMGIVFPGKFKAAERFNISEEDRLFVLKYMSQYPTESLYPPYAADTMNYWPAYCKFLFYGAGKGAPVADMRIFNKVGDAYGHMIDVAYVADFRNRIEFFVSAVIYCNSDGILNDDQYDYDSIGSPFMKNLGKLLYDYELKRKYKNRPDLSPVLFTYDSVPSKSQK